MKVQKRTGQIVDFDLEKIGNAIKKAFDSKQVEYDPAIVKSVDKLISLTYTCLLYTSDAADEGLV